MHFFISACAIHNCSHSINQFLLYPTSPFPQTTTQERCWSVSHKSRGGDGKLDLSEITGTAVGFSAQRLLLQHWGLTSHAAFQQQCPEGHESRVGGIPVFSQTPLYRSWRTPEVGLRAHPFNLSVLVGVQRVGTAQLGFSGVEVSLCNAALCTTLVRQHLVGVYQWAATWTQH